MSVSGHIGRPYRSFGQSRPDRSRGQGAPEAVVRPLPHGTNVAKTRIQSGPRTASGTGDPCGTNTNGLFSSSEMVAILLWMRLD
jgi:hypothetical protein